MGLFHGECKSWSWSLIMTSPVRHSQDPPQGVSLAGSTPVPALSGRLELRRDSFLALSGCGLGDPSIESHRETLPARAAACLS